MEDLDALLADLQQTTNDLRQSSVLNNTPNSTGVNHVSASSLKQQRSRSRSPTAHVTFKSKEESSRINNNNSNHVDSSPPRSILRSTSPLRAQSPPSVLNHLNSLERTRSRSPSPLRGDLLSPLQKLPETAVRDVSYQYQTTGDPIYQNQHVIHEVITTRGTSNRAQSPIRAANRLTELDAELDQVASIPFDSLRDGSSYTIRSISETTNDMSPPTLRQHRTLRSSPTDVHMEYMLDDLQRSVPGQKPTINNYSYKSSVTTTSTRRYGPPPSASSATRELDDLMASLSDFQVRSTSPRTINPSYARPNRVPVASRATTDRYLLDSMLGSLKNDMSLAGSAPKGHCAACNKPIVGQVVTALAKTWHPEHFICAHCRQELATKNFFERDGEPYCESDYHNIFSPRCTYCNGPILDKCVTALDKTWHPEHFFCAQCGKQFGEGGFHEKDGKAYCREDYFNLYAPKCGGCQMPIQENYISALNVQWHPECFVCRDCRQPFNGGSFYEHEGQPYCETHYHAKRGSLCAGCHKPISGRCITAMFRKYHPEHFVCSFCLKQLNKGTFKEQNDKPYCHECFDKLYS